MKWFGRAEPVGFTSRHDHWRYLAGTDDLPRSSSVLDRLCDLRIPLSLSEADCDTIAAVLAEAMAEAAGARQG